MDIISNLTMSYGIIGILYYVLKYKNSDHFPLNFAALSKKIQVLFIILMAIPWFLPARAILFPLTPRLFMYYSRLIGNISLFPLAAVITDVLLYLFTKLFRERTNRKAKNS